MAQRKPREQRSTRWRERLAILFMALFPLLVAGVVLLPLLIVGVIVFSVLGWC